jgi:hypothetical protein
MSEPSETSGIRSYATDDGRLMVELPSGSKVEAPRFLKHNGRVVDVVDLINRVMAQDTSAGPELLAALETYGYERALLESIPIDADESMMMKRDVAALHVFLEEQLTADPSDAQVRAMLELPSEDDDGDDPTG